MELTLNESIINIRVDLQNAKLSKSGKNSHGGFSYFELSDFLPALNELMKNYKVNDLITIKDNVITLTLIKGEERNEYSMPFIIFDTPVGKSGAKMMQDIQYLGAMNTYYKRYLYMNAFGITDGEVIDTLDNEKIKSEDLLLKERTRFKKICSDYNLNEKDTCKTYFITSKTTAQELKDINDLILKDISEKE